MCSSSQKNICVSTFVSMLRHLSDPSYFNLTLSYLSGFYPQEECLAKLCLLPCVLVSEMLPIIPYTAEQNSSKSHYGFERGNVYILISVRVEVLKLIYLLEDEV